MGCNTETNTVNDHEYSVTQWSATKALLMKLRMAKVFGSAFTIVASAISGDEEANEMEAFANGFSRLFENNDPEDIVALMKDSIVGVARDGTKITNTSFDEHFTGELMDIYKVFIFVIKVNYGNFFKGQWAESLLAKAEKIK